MIQLTVSGRPVFLSVVKSGYRVKWGKTIVASSPDWKTAVREIIALFKEYGA